MLNPTTADFTLGTPAEDGKMLMIVRESLSSVQPAVITATPATFSVQTAAGAPAVSATIAAPGDFLHVLYVASGSRWVVLAQRGVVFT